MIALLNQPCISKYFCSTILALQHCNCNDRKETINRVNEPITRMKNNFSPLNKIVDSPNHLIKPSLTATIPPLSKPEEVNMFETTVLTASLGCQQISLRLSLANNFRISFEYD